MKFAPLVWVLRLRFNGKESVFFSNDGPVSDAYVPMMSVPEHLHILKKAIDREPLDIVPTYQDKSPVLFPRVNTGSGCCQELKAAQEKEPFKLFFCPYCGSKVKEKP